MADETIRERIIQAFVERCEPLSSYPVLRCRRSDTLKTDKFVSVWDGSESIVTTRYGDNNIAMQIVIEAIWQAETLETASAEWNEYLGLVLSTVMGGDLTFSGLAEDMTYNRVTPSYPTDGDLVLMLRADFTINYVTLPGDPYNAP